MQICLAECVLKTSTFVGDYYTDIKDASSQDCKAFYSTMLMFYDTAVL